MLERADPVAFDERIEALTAALEASPDATIRDLARELVGLVLEFHREGLSRILATLNDNAEARARLSDDALVRSLLELHDLALGPSRPLIQISRRSDSPRATPAPITQEHGAVCGRCDAPLPHEHRHLVDLETRRLSCCCRACWLLAASDERSNTERAVPDRFQQRPGLKLTTAQWDALQIPVDVAFFMYNSVAGRTIAFYPSPAGATESALTLDSWHEIAAANPWVRAVSSDVEALLVRRDRDTGACSSFVVPIDSCYELVGRIRLSWAGINGGAAVGTAIDAFFNDVAMRCAEAPNQSGVS